MVILGCRVEFSILKIRGGLRIYASRKESTVFNLPGGEMVLKVFKQQNNMMRTSPMKQKFFQAWHNSNN